MQPKVEDVVRVRFGAVEHVALVLAVRENPPEHLGKNGEPMLTVAFLAPERESAIEHAKAAYLPHVYIEHDVVHESQEFSPDYRVANGLGTPAQILTHRGPGEWFSESSSGSSDKPVQPEQKSAPGSANLLPDVTQNSLEQPTKPRVRRIRGTS